MPDAVPPLAAVLYEPGWDVEPLLAEVRDRLAARGDLRLGGVLPRSGAPLSNGRPEKLLEDLVTGDATSISQDLGPGSEECTLDPDGFTRSRFAITAAIEAGVDLVFVGKFSKQEAAGHGVRDEIAAAMIAGLPTLVVLRETQIEAWTAFAGEDFATLAPQADAVVAWALAATGRAV